MYGQCSVEKARIWSFRVRKKRKESIKEQIFRLAFGSLEMTAYKVFNRAYGQLIWRFTERKVAKKVKHKKKSQAREKDKSSTSQLFNFAADSYLERTSRPIYAILFLLPFIIFYEIGTILINTDVLNQSQTRVVAFVWLRQSLESIGFGGKLAWMAPPFVVVAILVGLQITSLKRWSFDVRDILSMAAECIALAVPLIVLILFLNSLGAPQSDAGQFTDGSAQLQNQSGWVGGEFAPLLSARNGGGTAGRLLEDIITGIGAGIYEELVFRLILICLLMVLFQDALRLSHKSSIILSVLISAALFSAHHHIVFLDGHLGRITDFDWTSFSFRTMAGIYFAILFAIRGFGITAGTHAFYDIIAAILNMFVFSQE